MKVIASLLVTLAFLILPSSALAAQLLITSDSKVVSANQKVVVSIEVDSEDPVNAVQATLEYPAEEFEYLTIEGSESAFAIKAQESQKDGLVTVARGSIKPVTGKGLVAKVIFEAKKDGANLEKIKYTPQSAIMRSPDSKNILSGSTIANSPGQKAGNQNKPVQIPSQVAAWWNQVFGFIKSLFKNR